jgi:polyhydroxyalkanoate synthase
MMDVVQMAFAAGQQAYKAGLLTWINTRRDQLGLPRLDWPAIGATPHEVVHTDGSARLLRYRGPRKGPPVLLVASLINRPWVLDLLPGRSVVKQLLDGGLDVWLLDWGPPRDADAKLRLDDYALSRLPRAAAEIEKRSGRAPHLLGYCMGGTLALLAVAAGRVEAPSVLALATPVALHDDGLLSAWSRTPSFDARELAATYGNVPPHLLQPAFKMLDPVGMVGKFVHLEEKLEDDAFLTFFLAMESWLEDSVSFPGGAFVDWIELYRSDALARGKLTLGRQKIDLGRVRCPVLNIVAEGDYITPRASSEPLAKLVGGEHELVRLRGGHIGLSTGGEAHRTLWPRAAEWFLTHSHQNVMRLHKNRKKRS